MKNEGETRVRKGQTWVIERKKKKDVEIRSYKINTNKKEKVALMEDREEQRTK